MTFPESLKSLQSELIDARRRYEDALRVTTDREVAALFLEMVELRMRAERQIHDIVGAAVGNDDGPGAFIVFLQRAIANVRASVVGTGAESLSGFVNDEARILLAYNNAIDECGPYRKITNLLESQRTAVLGMIVKMDHVIFEDATPAESPQPAIAPSE
jgi:hypothetical protein